MASAEEQNLLIKDNKSADNGQNNNSNTHAPIPSTQSVKNIKTGGAPKHDRYYHKYIKYKMKYRGLKNAWSEKNQK